MASAASSKSRGIPRAAIIGTVVAALVLVGVLVALSASGGGGSGSGGSGGAVTGAADVQAQFAGIPQSGDRLGVETAPVEIVEYGDLQCPFCAQASAGTVPALVTDFVKPGTAKLVFRPLTFIGPDSVRGATAVAAAGAQGKMWTYAELLYRNQGQENKGWLSDKMVDSAATALGLNVAKFDADRTGPAASALVTAAATAAQTAGVSATPTFVVTGPKGRVVISDFTNLGEFQAAISGVR
jgi:protein-disulfide isomerase